MSYGLQIDNQQSSIILPNQQNHQLLNPSQLFPQQQMILLNSLQKSVYTSYPHMIQPQINLQNQGFYEKGLINTQNECYLNSFSSNNSQKPDQKIPNKLELKTHLGDEQINLWINNQIQERKDQQKMNYYNSKRKTLDTIKIKQNDDLDTSSSKDTLGQKYEIQQNKSELNHVTQYQNDNKVDVINPIIKKENESENKINKICKSYEQNQNIEELKARNHPKQQQITFFNQLNNQSLQTGNTCEISKNKEQEQKLLQLQQQNSYMKHIQDDEEEFTNQYKLYQIQYFEKQTCGFRQRIKNDAQIEIQSTINQSFQYKDASIKIENNFLNKTKNSEQGYGDQKMQSPLQIHSKQTLSKLDKQLLKKRKLCQIGSKQLLNKSDSKLKLENTHESLPNYEFNHNKKPTIKIQQDQKQNLNLNNTKVIEKSLKLEDSLLVNSSSKKQNGLTQEQNVNKIKSCEALSDEFSFDMKNIQLPNLSNEKTSYKNKKEEKSDQKQKYKIQKQLENGDGFFDQYEDEELWEDSFFDHMKQNSRSGGKSFFLVSNYKKKLFKQLDESDQSVILQMKKSKKFNFSKNVIKQFIKVMNSSINYVYIYDENTNNKSKLQSLILNNERDYTKIKCNTEYAQKVTQEKENETLNIDQANLSQFNHYNYKKIKENQNATQIDQQSVKKFDKFDRTKYVQIKNPSQSLINELRQKLKNYLISTSYTHFSLKKIISHQYYSLYFQDFLENYSDEWLQSGKTKYKNEQKIMIHFLKLCFINRKLLIFLSQHDPLQNKDSNQNK
ncbi:hypothetical protein ABPG74_017828 [Tetrahymena malaccensis]